MALILADGFSSKDQVTELSGRGMGLSAVLEKMKALDGEFSVELGERRGDSRYPLYFDLLLPLSYVWMSGRELSVSECIEAA